VRIKEKVTQAVCMSTIMLILAFERRCLDSTVQIVLWILSSKCFYSMRINITSLKYGQVMV
jgi:hypothetical protein